MEKVNLFVFSIILMLMSKYHTKNHCKYLIKLHIVLCVKYRKKLLVDSIDEDIKQWSMDTCKKNDVVIDMMESDADHLHLLVDIPHTLRISDLIKILKQQTAWNVWRHHSSELKHHFWREKTFWSDGHFVCSTGDVSTETILEYIRTQG
jgi:putative transposase